MEIKTFLAADSFVACTVWLSATKWPSKNSKDDVLLLTRYRWIVMWWNDLVSLIGMVIVIINVIPITLVHTKSFQRRRTIFKQLLYLLAPCNWFWFRYCCHFRRRKSIEWKFCKKTGMQNFMYTDTRSKFEGYFLHILSLKKSVFYWLLLLASHCSLAMQPLYCYSYLFFLTIERILQPSFISFFLSLCLHIL